ncbi:MAG TPA: DUF3164 family protein [Roseateles sp.]|uniref:DUF3164 family protein n=1 Tax=Roseateles sp. TaxID=1971397 RepID=UPI002EDADCE8
MIQDLIPAGYRKDAKGRLINEKQIKPIDLARDELVTEIVAKAKELQAVMRKFKTGTFGDIAAFVALSGEQYRVQLGGTKGNVTLVSFDGRYKVLRAIQDRITFDERLQAAKALIDQCLTDWTENARDELRTLINDAFRVDAAGNIRTMEVLRLRRLEIEDERWQRAMTAIGEAVQVESSKSYIRIYERDDETGLYNPIALDLAVA